MIARALVALKPWRLTSTVSRHASASGSGNARRPSRGSDTACPRSAARRFSNWIPTASDSCWQAMPLTSASKTVGKRGGWRPRIRAASGPSSGPGAAIAANGERSTDSPTSPVECAAHKLLRRLIDLSARERDRQTRRVRPGHLSHRKRNRSAGEREHALIRRRAPAADRVAGVPRQRPGREVEAKRSRRFNLEFVALHDSGRVARRASCARGIGPGVGRLSPCRWELDWPVEAGALLRSLCGCPHSASRS